MERIARGEKPAGVVGTLMTNKAVEVALRSRASSSCAHKVGDRYVLEELEKRRWLLGGEGSGHLLALDRHTTGDGIVSALQVLQACVRSGKSVAELLAGVTLFPQTLINVRLAEGQDWKANKAAGRRNTARRGRTGRCGPRADSRQRHRAAAARDGRGARCSAGRGLRAAPGCGGPGRLSAMVDVVLADYRNPAHARALVDLLDAYARDPAGGGAPLSADVMAETARGARRAAAGLQRAGLRRRTAGRPRQLHRGLFDLRLPAAGQRPRRGRAVPAIAASA